MIEAQTDVEIFDKYKIEIEDAKLHEISYDLQMDYLLTDATNTDSSEIINKLNMLNDAAVSSISKYVEMQELHEVIKHLYSDYQSTYGKNKNVNTLIYNRRSICHGIHFIMTRVNQLARIYNTFIKFILKDIKMLSELVADPSISWGSTHIERRIELIQKFNDRLIPCIDLLEDCDKLQPIVSNALTEMKATFNEMEDVKSSENFVNNFKIIISNQRAKLTGDIFKYTLDLLSDKINKKPIKGREIYNKIQKFNEIKDDSFKEVINDWKINRNLKELKQNPFSSTVEVPNGSRKRKIADISVNYD